MFDICTDARPDHSASVTPAFQLLKAKGMVPKAIIAAAMHELMHLIYQVFKTRQPFDANGLKKPLR